MHLRALFIIFVFALPAFAQSVVRPGAPGQPTKELPANTTAKLPPVSTKDTEFMQGMIMHHAQAVEMVDLLDTRTDNKAVKLLAERIRHTQSDEIGFMKRWLRAHGESTEMEMKMPEAKPAAATPTAGGHDHHGHHEQPKPAVAAATAPMHHDHLMPGMLSAKQMEALKAAKGREFDRLFLEGMIQHHGGAIIMVKELFDSAGAGQDAELFNFASDVDSGQRAEIRRMETLLKDIR